MLCQTQVQTPSSESNVGRFDFCTIMVQRIAFLCFSAFICRRKIRRHNQEAVMGPSAWGFHTRSGWVAARTKQGIPSKSGFRIFSYCAVSCATFCQGWQCGKKLKTSVEKSWVTTLLWLNLLAKPAEPPWGCRHFQRRTPQAVHVPLNWQADVNRSVCPPGSRAAGCSGGPLLRYLKLQEVLIPETPTKRDPWAPL